MFKTYLKLAVRTLLKNKTFTIINIFGLAIGLTCCMLISMYLFKEFNYDKHHTNGTRLYQIGTIGIKDGNEDEGATTPAPMAPAMLQDFPEVENYARLLPAFMDDKTLFQYNAGKEVLPFYESKGYFADSTFFRLFDYTFTEGDPATALNEPNTLVISEDIAEKIFGNEPALNKIIHINGNTNNALDFKVTGVFKPSTKASHIDGRFFMSIKSGEIGQWINSMTDMVNNNMFYSYLLLKPGADEKQLQAKFEAFINKHAGADLKASGRYKKQFLTKVEDVHLYGAEGNVTAGGNPKYLYILISIAFITLLIACVNFMNLSTARSAKRAIEIGVRKVLGAEKNSLVKQFLGEAILLSAISFIVSILLSFLLTPLFENISGKELIFSTQQYIILGVSFLIITIIAGLVAGLYPAFYLSAFKPIKVLKGKLSNSLAAVSFRKVLVVFQFVISVALIVASISIGNQMSYMRNKDLGFQKEEQLMIPLRTTNAKAIYPAMKNELSSNSAISTVGGSLYYPGIANVTDWLMYKQGTAPDETRTLYVNSVDENFLQTLGVKLIAGRLFSKDFTGDTSYRIIINEKAVKEFGFASAENAIGKNIAATRDEGERLFPIIGVVKDFHFDGLKNEIKAFGFLLSRSRQFNYMIAHVNPGAVKPALEVASSAWSKINPNEPFEYSFLDQDFQKNYEEEERLAALIRYFTIIAIFISCLGLFGLTTFSIEQRTKEIGIRKVLGANTAGIVSLLSKDFLKLVFISFIIATPLAWYFINNWLQSFAYKAPFSIWIILLSCLTALFIAFATISFQAIKAALMNPVKSLRTE